MTDYTVHYRRCIDLDSVPGQPWDTVVSAYNGSERVQAVFDRFGTSRRHWLVHREYELTPYDYPITGDVFAPTSLDEAEFLAEYLAVADADLRAGHLCVDITGFMRPHLMLLVRMLRDRGIRRFDALYTDPVRYVRSESTTFTDGPVMEVRQIAGFEGSHTPVAGGSDLLVIGAGYDHELVQVVADNKTHARKRLMFGLPSLQPDMYQESRLRMARASEAIGTIPGPDALFAPANNPFVTAQELSEAVAGERSGKGVSNLYLCPLGTKPQALGFALFYLGEEEGSETSVIFPMRERYSRETTEGISRIWVYSIEL